MSSCIDNSNVNTKTLSAPASIPDSASPSTQSALKALWPYLWKFRFRVGLAIACLVAAKFANIGVPLVLKNIVDSFAVPGSLSMKQVLAVPVALIFAYGFARLSISIFTELREFLFQRVTLFATRDAALKAFVHLHSLGLRFHLERRTGQVTREIDHGMRGISSLVSYTLYSVFPTLVELCLVIGYLLWQYESSFGLIMIASLSAYIVWTIKVTNWRTQYRQEMVKLDAKASARAVDSLLNFETVKYFNNERFEAKRYDETLAQYEKSHRISQQSLNLLNIGQQIIIALGVTLIVWRACVGVANGSMSLGDLVLVNALMLQLYVPLNFLGVIYREVKQALVDVQKMFGLLEEHREIADSPSAKPIALEGAAIEFENVRFGYDSRREILQGVSFSVPAGKTVAVVGASGAGKSTLARLLFRFYDIQSGRITIDGQAISDVTQSSLRQAIGIVPQDTVLFNDSIFYNIAYGRPEATREEVIEAARAAQLDAFIAKLPEGYDTVVGERGLKLSGGEKQRVAIARCLLKSPRIVIFDEATSALDSETEGAIQAELRAVALGRTTLVIAHRLSTIAAAHEIVVIDEGQVAERGTHDALLARGGRYAELWRLQSSSQG
jgi:ATP-binding cassette, subfamily B, heavy metal transporter